MAFIGNGAQLTDLDAGDIASGTLAVARGGTGTASPSLVGGTNITISGSWPNQTVTASGGGVTSLNGQTGAITNTDLYAIGSYITGRPQNTTSYAINSTVAGSILYSTQPITYLYRSGKGVYSWSYSSNPAIGVGPGGSPTIQLTGSGTWRCISHATYSGQYGITCLWVRIS